MPFHFKLIDDISEYSQYKSVLIIPCRFCPAASASISSNEHYFEFFRKFLRRQKLLNRAKEYEALIVLGCEAAVNTVKDAVQSASCKVFQGLETKGIMSIQPRIHLPANISLELQSLTPLALQKK
jgi:hypothetical protein